MTMPLKEIHSRYPGSFPFVLLVFLAQAQAAPVNDVLVARMLAAAGDTVEHNLGHTVPPLTPHPVVRCIVRNLQDFVCPVLGQRLSRARVLRRADIGRELRGDGHCRLVSTRRADFGRRCRSWNCRRTTIGGGGRRRKRLRNARNERHAGRSRQCIARLEEAASFVTESPRGAGVAELADRLIATDLVEVDATSSRQRVALIRVVDDTLCFSPTRQSILLAGSSGDGKSTLSTGLLERLNEKQFQYCVIDPEGDYEGTDEAICIGSAEQAPTAGSVMELLRKIGNNVVVNLLGMRLADRPGFLAALLPDLLSLRTRTGRPHFVVVDEAHHMLPANWDPGGVALPAEMKGFLFITVHPDRLSARVLECIDRIIVVGGEPYSALRGFCDVRGLSFPQGDVVLEHGDALTLTPSDPDPMQAKVIPGTGLRRRHLRRYFEGRLGEDKSFFFRGPDERLNLRAHNLTLFVELGDGVDEATWQWHREQGDYSRWIEDFIKDPELAAEVGGIEQGSVLPKEARRRLHDAWAALHIAGVNPISGLRDGIHVRLPSRYAMIGRTFDQEVAKLNPPSERSVVIVNSSAVSGVIP